MGTETFGNTKSKKKTLTEHVQNLSSLNLSQQNLSVQNLSNSRTYLYTTYLYKTDQNISYPVTKPIITKLIKLKNQSNYKTYQTQNLSNYKTYQITKRIK